MLVRIQNDLFDVEADLCMPSDKGKGPGGARLTVTDAQVDWLEGEIDRLNADLAPLKSFILPGGSPAAAYLHLARTVCRRAERIMVELKDKPGERVTPAALKYVNRLSDFLFVAGRYANDKGRARRAVGAGPEPRSRETICNGDAALRRQSVHAADQAGRHLVPDRAQFAVIFYEAGATQLGARAHDRHFQPHARRP